MAHRDRSHLLKEGANRIDGAPGVFELNKGKTLFRGDRGGSVSSEGKPISTIQLDKPDISFDAGPMNFRVIERSGPIRCPHQRQE
jgi:hypothetical protein